MSSAGKGDVKAGQGEPQPQPPPPYSTLPPGQQQQQQQASMTQGHGMQPPAAGLTFVTPVVPAMGSSVTYVLGFGPHPKQTVCPSCNQEVVSETRPAVGLLTWLLVGAMVMVGCGFGCCLIPCCVAECQDVEHWCPNCRRHMGTYKRIG